MVNKKIKILGAGISGLTAGIILSKHGYQVEIFEKRPQVGSFFDSCIHSIKNFFDVDILAQYKKLGIEIPANIVFPVKEIYVYAPSQKYYKLYSGNKPLFYNFLRGKNSRSLDNYLYSEAKKYGVKFYFGSNLTEENVDIVASGAKEKSCIGYGKFYNNSSNTLNTPAIYFFSNNDYAPKGYIYATFFDNKISVVSVCFDMTKSHIPKQMLNEAIKTNKDLFLLTNGTDIVAENDIFGFGYYPISIKTAQKGKRLYIGEAAGFLDSSRGFGVHYAITSGALAAKAIVEKLDYDDLWKNELGKELEERIHKRIYLQKLNNDDYEKFTDKIISCLGSEIDIKDYLKEKANFL